MCASSKGKPSWTQLRAPSTASPAPPAMAGAATGAGVMKAAKVTAVVGGEAVRLAVPATKWALGVGLRMALGAVSAVEKQERRRKDGPPSEL